MAQFAHLVFLATEGVFTSGTAAGAEKQEIVHREILLVKHTEKLLTYCAAGAYYSYIHWE